MDEKLVREHLEQVVARLQKIDEERDVLRKLAEGSCRVLVAMPHTITLLLMCQVYCCQYECMTAADEPWLCWLESSRPFDDKELGRGPTPLAALARALDAATR